MAAPSFDKLAASLQDSSGNEPLDARFRALFTLKGLAPNDTQKVINIIDKAFDNNDSALLKHELAYVLGQIQDERAITCLERVLRDAKEHPMVRHEAAEAMGAISSQRALPILNEFLQDENVSVRETCELALEKIEYDHGISAGSSNRHKTNGEESEGAALARAKAAASMPEESSSDTDNVDGSFLPIDPAPAHSLKVDTLLTSIPLYKAQLTAGDSLPLFQRYRAMFSLRNAVHAARRRSQQPNISSSVRQQYESQANDAIKALADGLSDKSALFRHEICFVFGELAHPACAESMVRVLSDSKEEEMVRHEAAEALGAVVEEGEEASGGEADQIQATTAKIMSTLKRWAEDQQAPRVVRESCIVALDEMAYNNDPSQFQPVA
ncbi:ARM repeat-containing protein [Meira miltonrushii]|uniref:Deoxyhypusine hydroxylase n=1 Tax=Meira miltonrushii TaxID=1280837 RepID=A0A316V4T2_9BASI|nr:ARM repeat-containing protein [Meira miltonrushii]PWN32530.1 ARM repeat-containing protein [Meira miltonrushii]